MSDTPAGWYPHPRQFGQDLYWDGSGWTGEARPSALAPPPPAGAAVPPAGPGHPRPRGAWAAATLIPIILVLAIGGVIVLVIKPPSSQGVLSRALAATLAERSADAAISGSEHIDGVVVPITGHGVFDFVHNDGSTALSLSLLGRTIKTRTITARQSVYVDLGPAVSKVLPGKTWLSMGLSQYSAQGGAASGLGSGGTGTGNPGAIFDILGNGSNVVTALGGSTINGVPVQGYLVVVNRAAVRAAASNPHRPEWLRQAAKSVSDEKVGYKVFVGPSGKVYRFTTGLSEVAGGQPIEVFASMDFSHFGTAVRVMPPPTSRVGSYGAFLKAAEAQQSGTLN